MDEKEKLQTDATDNKEEGDKSESTKLIEHANEAAERLEKANAKQEELLIKQEELMAKQALGGRTEGGILKEKDKPISDKDYAKMFRDGEIPLSDVLQK